MSAGVFLQIPDEVVAAGPAPVGAGDPVPGQSGREPGCVEAEAVVARTPAGGNLSSSLQDKRVDAPLLEHRRGREAGRSGPHDHHLLRIHAPTLSGRSLALTDRTGAWRRGPAGAVACRGRAAHTASRVAACRCRRWG